MGNKRSASFPYTQTAAYRIDAGYSARIDILKVLLIIMVVYIHANSGQLNFTDQTVFLESPASIQTVKTVLSSIICRVATPLFMLISSVLLYRKPFIWAQNMRKKVKSIGIPYLFWNCLWIFVFFVAQSIPYFKQFFPNPDNLVRSFSSLDWVMAFTGNPLGDWSGSWTPFYYPFWFLKDLFIYNLCATAIKKAVDTAPFTFLALAFISWVCSLRFYIVGSESFFFFTLGCYIVKYNLGIGLADRLRCRDILPLYIATVAAELLLEQKLGGMIGKINILIGIIFFVKLSRGIYRHAGMNKFFLWLSSFVFMIFGFHEFTLSFSRKLLGRLLPQTALIQLLEYLVLPLLIIALCVFAGLIMRKRFPRFYRMVTGGR